MHAAERFHAHFVAELKDEGSKAAAIARHAWKPTPVEALSILGEQRDRDLARLEASTAALDALPAPVNRPALDTAFWQAQKVVLVLVPGFTHETLKNYSWHEQIQRRDSPHHVVMLHPADGDGPTREQAFTSGGALKLLYLRYPRSNADSRFIVPALFTMLRDCASLRQWIADGYKLLFVGYSYGAPLSLELLAALNAGEFSDTNLLANTLGFLSLCGDVGGSYLADDVLRPDPQLLSIRKVIAFCRRHPLLAKLAGLGTPQLLADMEDGVRSLGHEVRQSRMRHYAPKLPTHLTYFSISAVMPLQDYRRRWWHFNLDDYAMYRQALVTDPIAVYNDGQVAMPDNLMPDRPQLRCHHLGAVRTHHWGVSYRTFNFGRNRFPRRAFYRALLRTMLEQLGRMPA